MIIDGKTKANNNPQKELLLAFDYLMAEADRLSAALVVPDVSGREIHPTIVIHLEHVHTILVETFALSDFFHHPFHLFMDDRIFDGKESVFEQCESCCIWKKGNNFIFRVAKPYFRRYGRRACPPVAG